MRDIVHVGGSDMIGMLVRAATVAALTLALLWLDTGCLLLLSSPWD
jgi:hypothetical protein